MWEAAAAAAAAAGLVAWSDAADGAAVAAMVAALCEAAAAVAAADAIVVPTIVTAAVLASELQTQLRMHCASFCFDSADLNTQTSLFIGANTCGVHDHPTLKWSLPVHEPPRTGSFRPGLFCSLFINAWFRRRALIDGAATGALR